MKKLLILLLLLIGITYTSCLTTHALTTSFYEGEYIDGIWMNKYNPNNHTIYYQKARFFRQVGTNEFAYCIEPFSFFNESSTYESTVNPYNLTSNQLNRISNIAHFGYNYKNHNDPKWYAITQFMIWQTADPSGDYYFTDSLNGNRINPYQNEINEINNLINNYNTHPSFENKTFYQVENQQLIINDTNNVINNYSINDSNITINNNSLIVNYQNEGEYTVSLLRQDNIFNKPIIFFQSSNSQNLVETGDINEIISNLKIIVQKTNLTINKLDKDTDSIVSSGDASLNGAIYHIYNEKDELIKEVTIIDNKASIDNLDYGKYYIKEIKAGEGYELDTEIHEIELSPENPVINLKLYNSVIKGTLIVNKKYGDDDDLHNEENISFNIYNSNNELVDTITTNNEGIASIELPYGRYTLEQINTKDGYNKNDIINFIIDSNEEKHLLLKDLKIKVPNTYSKFSLFQVILILFSIIIC